ncbi:uncharacterized protein V2V93DRAFT_362690 [Kockiozyma suomiensis]|uniref:uncharacterized protein n=1 Tax=Kockiozyma suomiensis TaxID=1337062 RepID=UPI003343F609
MAVAQRSSMARFWVLTPRGRPVRRLIVAIAVTASVCILLFAQHPAVASSVSDFSEEGAEKSTVPRSNQFVLATKLTGSFHRACYRIFGCVSADDAIEDDAAANAPTSSAILSIATPTPSPVLTPAQLKEQAAKAARWENFASQYRQNRALHFDANPLAKLTYCSNPAKKPGISGNLLVSAATDESTMARIRFTWKDRTPRYNPNILPYPPGSKYPYFGIARISPRSILFHHDLVWCDLRWTSTRTIGRPMLECAAPAQKLKFGHEWPSAKGACMRHPFLTMQQGHSDPRVYLSPLGEPLMVVGTNGKHNCLHQFIIDLRVLVPHLARNMKIEHVPIRYKVLTELTRPSLSEIEKNWFVIYDEKNTGWIQHDTHHRTISLLDPPPAAKKDDLPVVSNIANPSPKIVTSLIKTFKDKKTMANDLHQASTSLRVTLCDFPCIPTIHNTVLVELLHVKYKNYYELFYRRFAVIMNATAPFDIIGRTGPLHYAGVDEQTMIYTVSMVWDHLHYPSHEPWDEQKHGGQDVWRVLGERDRQNDELRKKAEAERKRQQELAKQADVQRKNEQEKLDRERAEATAREALQRKKESQQLEQDRLEVEREHMLEQEETTQGVDISSHRFTDDDMSADSRKEAAIDSDEQSIIEFVGQAIDRILHKQVFSESTNPSSASIPSDASAVASPTLVASESMVGEDGFIQESSERKKVVKRDSSPPAVSGDNVEAKSNSEASDTSPDSKPETKPESEPESKQETKPEFKQEIKPESKPETKTAPPKLAQNPLVNKYYHGWLNDVLMIQFGINDHDSGTLHVRARDLLDCILVA